MKTGNMKIVISTLLLTAAGPAFAQDEVGPGGERINQLIIYGDDVCPESSDDEIIVCARLDESDRYRIPANLRSDPNNLKGEAWSQRVRAYESVAASGTLSCSPSGAGGFTGCGLAEINKAYAEKAQDPGISFGLLVAEARRKRLEGIDAEAEEVEERVKQFEKDRAAREAREAGDAFPDDDSVAGAEVPADPE